MQQNDEISTVNGIELIDKDSIRRAFDYLSKDYNDGDIVPHAGLDGETIVLVSRNQHMEHWSALMDAAKRGHINIVNVGVAAERRAKVEIR